MAKKRPYQAVPLRRSTLSRRVLFALALTGAGAAQPWTVLAAERSVLCEEFTNDT